jgi:hypothetical protein
MDNEILRDVTNTPELCVKSLELLENKRDYRIPVYDRLYSLSKKLKEGNPSLGNQDGLGNYGQGGQSSSRVFPKPHTHNNNGD